MCQALCETEETGVDDQVPALIGWATQTAVSAI